MDANEMKRIAKRELMLLKRTRKRERLEELLRDVDEGRTVRVVKNSYHQKIVFEGRVKEIRVMRIRTQTILYGRITYKKVIEEWNPLLINGTSLLEFLNKKILVRASEHKKIIKLDIYPGKYKLVFH